jgi:hypothetical protein
MYIYPVVAIPLSKSACLPWWGFCPDLEDVLEVNNKRQARGGATTYLLVPDLKHILEVGMKAVLLFLDHERIPEVRNLYLWLTHCTPRKCLVGPSHRSGSSMGKAGNLT